jgi:hypothetical protein
VKYFRLYKEREAKPQEVSKKRAYEILSRNYNSEAIEELLDNSSREHPVNSMFAYYWVERDYRKQL